ncbi:hypothetical protein M1P56_30970 [Streptomyces sp. HU2014]|uniref:hypothetical protein n=1 Tax=Streptomyces sp. HU2014 TaxID=2939414 RepID=UPI00200FEFBC|nr:hypothetical protein [Streptomyces sp. HU2014]UQI48429.1 hypothetical protein M1P56_30970 [Streptomyces sp. HU2014]
MQPKDNPGPEPTDELCMTCQWCTGSGFVQRSLLHVPGPDPFGGGGESAVRAGQCRHCRGSGVYDSELDPTLEHWRGRPEPEPPAGAEDGPEDGSENGSG